ncbi:succinate dehydrogenase assembly factor 2 [Paracoccus alkenifer]|uniref:FAD assembly factor SdhE n=1 Tax=Paracoccus alkenifer TaxID=65735 RepID=A0A1H6N0I0_9RHOB|nr:succinate dehydrogenase assembly factor 2 [Paracoccus alkenifer]SEI04781.1 antitoxin CptB [Paracoccus alkenifer]
MEHHDTRIKRLTMRSWRRGTREMDLILGPFADTQLAALEPVALADYERLLDENDQDLYPWITARLAGKVQGPQSLGAILDRIAAHARDRLKEIRGA